MDSKKKIYLHIGLPKTGSTTLQYFLKENEGKLKKLGYFIPERQSNCENQAHTTLANQFKDTDAHKKDGLIDNVLKEINTTELKNIIISSEGFSQANLSILSNCLAPFSVKIIVYIRRQDDLLSSTYLEQTKKYNCLEFDLWLKKYIIEKKVNFLDFYKKWKEYFQDIVMVPLEKDHLIGEDLIIDFCHRLDIPSHELKSLVRVSSKNEGLSEFAIKTLLVFNNYLKILDKRAPGKEIIIKKSIIKIISKAFPNLPKYKPMDAEQSKKIMMIYKESNEILSKEILDLKKPLFANKVFEKNEKETLVSLNEVSAFHYYALSLLFEKHPEVLNNKKSKYFKKLAIESFPDIKKYLKQEKN